MVVPVQAVHERAPDVVLAVLPTRTLRTLVQMCDIFLRRLVCRLIDALNVVLGGVDLTLGGIGLEDPGHGIVIGPDGLFDFAGGIIHFGFEVVLKDILRLLRLEARLQIEDIPLMDVVHVTRVAELTEERECADRVAPRERMRTHHLSHPYSMPLYLTTCVAVIVISLLRESGGTEVYHRHVARVRDTKNL